MEEHQEWVIGLREIHQVEGGAYLVSSWHSILHVQRAQGFDR